MEEEMVNIVDENNVTLYQTSKKEAHIRGCLHETIIAEIINPAGDWYLVRQSSDRQDAGKLVSPVGGHVRTGESYRQALKREVFEETGIKSFVAVYKGKTIYSRKVRDTLENHYFVIYELHTTKIPHLGPEAEEFVLFPLATLKKRIQYQPELFGQAFFPVIRTAYKDLFSLTS
ncbi:NUDIX hydrolase [Candidatus Roizmanbacteria bacterium]|nr:NUDIX hydrolase [Candidatus Roizmanbacteria bacterium]